MGARRIVNKQNQGLSLTNIFGSRTFKLGVIFLLLIACSMFFMKLDQKGTLPFKTIQIVGQLNWIKKSELNKLVIQNLNGGFFSLDVNRLKQSLEGQAWIKLAGIRRIWPDVLQIAITEQQPVAIWNDTSVPPGDPAEVAVGLGMV